MKVKILKACTVICEPGSIVEVSERQFLALGDFAKLAEAEEKVEAPKRGRKPKEKED